MNFDETSDFDGELTGPAREHWQCPGVPIDKLIKENTRKLSTSLRSLNLLDRCYQLEEYNKVPEKVDNIIAQMWRDVYSEREVRKRSQAAIQSINDFANSCDRLKAAANKAGIRFDTGGVSGIRLTPINQTPE